MAIVKMNKFTLLSFESQKGKLLEALQGFQGVQFINLQEEGVQEEVEALKGLKKDEIGSSCNEFDESLMKLKFSLDFLQEYSPKKGGIMAMLENKEEIPYETLVEMMNKSDWHDVYLALKEKEVRLNELANEVTKLRTEIATLDKWKAFDAPFKDLKTLKHTSYFLGTVAKQYEDKLLSELKEEVENSYYEVLNRDNQDMYFFCLVNNNEKEKTFEVLKKYGFSSFTLTYDGVPASLINQYSENVESLLKEEQKIKESIKTFNDKREVLQKAFDYYNNLILRFNATENFLKTEKVITICGWNTNETNSELEEIIKKSVGDNYYIAFEAIKDEEIKQVPIKLKNGKFSSAFESLIEMYSMPQYNEVDPTPIMAIFYFVFFGMMLSDAGYGLVIVLASAFALWKVKDEEKRKSFKLFLFAGISTVIWGAIYGGWFGDLLPEYFNIKVPQLLDPAKDITTIFILSLAFGVVHIFIGLGIKGYILIKRGQIKDAIYDVLTWYLTLIGAILMLVGVGGSIGSIMLSVGLLGLLLTQGRTAPTLAGKIGGGIYGVYGITGYLGDVVSYSRLLALGLATGFIANALNLIINLVPSPAKYLLAPFMFIGLHCFNLLINALGSYVHAARLQYLEFFSKFYEGGGKKFSPFKLSDKYIKITK